MKKGAKQDFYLSKIKNKKAAMELSVSTIVVIVLAMSMLILGIVLIRNIFKGSTSVVDMTNEQLKNQVMELFGNEEKLVVYPDTQVVDIKVGERGGFGIGIRNKLSGAQAQDAKFSYAVSVADPDLRSKCGFAEKDAEAFIAAGGSDDNIPLAPAESLSNKVILQIPEGTTPCIVQYRVDVKVNGVAYANKYMSIAIIA